MPKLSGDPDMQVMGSENGLGKTSLIECCALLLMCLSVKESHFELENGPRSIDVPDLLIRAGADVAEIKGDITIGEEKVRIGMGIDRSGSVNINGGSWGLKWFEDNFTDANRDVDELINTICGFSSNPVIEHSFLLFHSYRKVQEGNPELGTMIRDSETIRPLRIRRRTRSLSTLKLLILRLLMNKADLFEFTTGDESNDGTLDQLNELVKFYAGGTISKLRPSAENTVDFRITPVNGGKSLTFDGLSSGQKEIISTLFLIWYHTKDNPTVVFIDEPELHLNAQWHRSFVNRLIELAPRNQYVMATHSEDIMDSVSEDRRILLLNDKENAND
ncbi:AAA family ATPase [Candidatus Haliotispira prima]|uniref:AAA family ATPase n=1 Tax=Candidatus Haliotispira prima TaxID=3034016 RepID=A0ABY8MFN5_9SPIO|nr:AAA family ATPase [Candidatus Haliotispira prima]